jgi:hypothetical protein
MSECLVAGISRLSKNGIVTEAALFARFGRLEGAIRRTTETLKNSGL